MTDEQVLQAMQTMLQENNRILKQEIIGEVRESMTTQKQEILGEMRESLTAMDARMDEKLATQKQEILGEMREAMAAQKQEIMGEVQKGFKEQLNAFNAVIEEKVTKEILIIAEGHSNLLRRLPEEDEIPNMKSRIRVLERVVQEHSAEIDKLSKAL